MSSEINNHPDLKRQTRQLILSGLIPVILFTLIENYYGVKEGLIAAVIYAFFEITYEKIKYKKISGMTWFGNGLVIGLGFISILLNDGIWFKLQPAIFEALFALVLIGSYFLKKPLLKIMAAQQNANAPERALQFMSGLTLRLGFFFVIQTVLAIWAALKWSTEMWAALKSVGLFIMLALYLGIEILILRRKVSKSKPH